MSYIKYVLLQHFWRSSKTIFFTFRLSDHSGCSRLDGVLNVILLTMLTTARMDQLVKAKKKEAHSPTALFQFSTYEQLSQKEFPLLLPFFSRGGGERHAICPCLRKKCRWRNSAVLKELWRHFNWVCTNCQAFSFVVSNSHLRAAANKALCFFAVSYKHNANSFS